MRVRARVRGMPGVAVARWGPGALAGEGTRGGRGAARGRAGALGGVGGQRAAGADGAGQPGWARDAI